LRGDQLAGTAARAHGWVLIEHPGPWPFGGFAELPLSPEIIETVRRAAGAAGMRILLIRRHGRRRAGRERVWGVLRYDAHGAHRQEWGTWSDETALLHVAQAIARPGATGHPPLYLVCTHGIHDACCAILGRPVVRALAEEWPARTWECSHVGGDRYAANVVVVPDGVYFGDVTPQQAVAEVARLEAGLVSAEHLRGYCDLIAPAQFAVAEVLRRFGPAGRHAIRLLGAEPAGDRWGIALACDPPLPTHVEVQVQVRGLPAARLTCRAPAPSRAIAYEVVRFIAS
jgi:hypothetical protein